MSIMNSIFPMEKLFENNSTPFFYKQSIFDPHPNNCLKLKNRPKK